MPMKSFLALALATTALSLSAPVAAQPVADAGKLQARLAPSRCSALLAADFSAIPEAGAQVVRVTPVAASGEIPAYCDVRGAIAPNVGFALKLPEANWNGRFFQAGCGNYCGIIYERACDDPLKRGYACIATDAGHVARPEDTDWTDGQWAENNLQAELDWGGRASHVTAVAGKAITRAFYGQPAAKAYYVGCSYGGHQAMVLAQRYPYDFDGIVGGGAPNVMSNLMQQNLWALSVAFRPDMSSVFSQADVETLHKAVLASCDMDDGVRDGLVGDPASCKVDLAAITCKAGQGSGCLDAKAAQAAAKLYSGPVDEQGRRISTGGWAPGTELYWRKVYRPDGTGLAALAKNYFQYMGRDPVLGRGWSPASYDFTTDSKRNDVMETLYAADNPDLRRFKAAGGKFINYAGWSDMGTLPSGAADYYETAERTMGGRAATQSFFRTFIIPGALHCRGGDGAESIDFLSYIEAWVERGQAPDVMVGAHKDPTGAAAFTRPVYPYPVQARYKGVGDRKDAASFKPVMR